MESWELTVEWDFSKCPKEELRDCLFYELAREIPEWRKKVAHFRSDEYKQSQMFGSTGLLGHFGGGGITPDVMFECNIAFIVKIDEWPEKPWLSLPQQRRKELTQRDLDSRFNFSNFMQGHVGALWLDNNHYADTKTHKNGEHEVTYAVAKIDWRYSDNDLEKQFKNWLATLNRPHKPVETRGRGLDPMDVLKTIGAHRLLKSMTWLKAAEYTASFNSKGIPLYTNQSAWIRAKNKACEAIEVFQKTQFIDNVLRPNRIRNNNPFTG